MEKKLLLYEGRKVQEVQATTITSGCVRNYQNQPFPFFNLWYTKIQHQCLRGQEKELDIAEAVQIQECVFIYFL